MKTLAEMIDTSGPILTPHVATLIPCLLKASGELETPKLSHISTQLSANAEAQELIDSMRADAAKQNQSTETLTKVYKIDHIQDSLKIRSDASLFQFLFFFLSQCIRYIDIPALEKMTPDVIEIIRTSVNLGTKIACAHFICSVCGKKPNNTKYYNHFTHRFLFLGVQISIRFNNEMQPLVGKYLSVCFNNLKDRNNIVRKYYASAIGHLIGLAKVGSFENSPYICQFMDKSTNSRSISQEQSVIRLFGKLSELYFENHSNKGIPQTIVAINKRHQDILKDYSNHVLPLIFYAMHEQITEETKPTVEIWKDLWTETSPGDAGIRMNLDSIIPQLERCLDDSSWACKSQSANAIKTIASRLGSNLGPAERGHLLASLLRCVAGRTFQGKECILQALASLCDGLKKSDDTQIHLQIIDAVMKECHKEEPIYRTHAIKALGEILEQLNEDRFEAVYNMVWHLMDKKDLASITGDDEDKSLTSDERNKRALIFINLKEAVCETLGKAWPSDSVETQNKYRHQFVERCCICLQNNTRPVQLALLAALCKFVNRLKCLEKNDDDRATSSDEKKQRIDCDPNLSKICKDILSAIVFISGNWEYFLECSKERQFVCQLCFSIISFYFVFIGIPHTGLKKEALNVLLALSNKLINKGAQNEVEMVRTTFQNILPNFQKDNSPEIKIRLNDLENKLKPF